MSQTLNPPIPAAIRKAHRPVPSVRIGSRRFNLPGNPILRIGFGIVLVLGGLVGFLPILGFWMVPLGLIVLSYDFPSVRRFRRRATVWLMRQWNRRVRSSA